MPMIFTFKSIIPFFSLFYSQQLPKPPQTVMILHLILLALPLFLLFLVRNHRNNGRTPLPPGPPGLPFIGNLLQISKTAPHLYLWQLSKQYGSLMFLRLGFVPTLVVSSARMAKEVMKTHDLEFSGRPSMLGLKNRFHELLGGVQTMSMAFFFSDHFPLMGWVDKLTGMIARLEKIFEELDLFCQEIIDEHLDPNRSKLEQEDITDVLLRLQKDRSSTVDLTWDHIKAMFVDIFVAGTDTSAATVVWAMTELMKNPIVMKKAQEELRNLIGKKGFVDEDDLQKLSYLKALVKETMRLHPAAPLLVPRETLEKCVIDGYEIAPKTLVFKNKTFGINKCCY
ncbi:unnamed protein product, partial [Vitis vinifera]